MEILNWFSENSVVSAQIITNIALLVGVVYVVFFKSYFTEKGKRVALKEDLEEVTKKVESIKAEMSLINQKKLELSIDEKKTLEKFFKVYQDTRHFFNRNKDAMFKNQSLKLKEYDLMVSEVNRLKVNLTILNISNDLYNSAHKAVQHLIALSGITKKYIRDIEAEADSEVDSLELVYRLDFKAQYETDLASIKKPIIDNEYVLKQKIKQHIYKYTD